jgi:hypothetical protein
VALHATLTVRMTTVQTVGMALQLAGRFMMDLTLLGPGVTARPGAAAILGKNVEVMHRRRNALSAGSNPAGGTAKPPVQGMFLSRRGWSAPQPHPIV